MLKTKKDKIQEVTEIFQELKSVQIDIKEMNDFAQAVVEGKIKTVINLKGDKLTKDYDPNKGYEDEEENHRPIIRSFFGDITANIKKAVEQSEFHITHNLDERLLLEVMAVLLRAKEEYRDFLIKQLKRHGLKL